MTAATRGALSTSRENNINSNKVVKELLGRAALIKSAKLRWRDLKRRHDRAAGGGETFGLCLGRHIRWRLALLRILVCRPGLGTGC